VRNRVPVLIGGVALLLLLALPALSLQLGLPAARRSRSPTPRASLRPHHGELRAGFNGALLVVADNVTAPDTGQTMAAELAKLPGVAAATPAATANGVAVVRVIPTTGPSDPATGDLVTRLRDNRALIEGTPARRSSSAASPRPTSTCRRSCSRRCRSS